MKIESNRAEVHTATIEVRTILIDKRQLTLSTFRQIPRHPLIDRESGGFAGDMWGTVNYFSTGDDEGLVWSSAVEVDPPRSRLMKRHVLFVTEGELRRCPVVEPHWVTLVVDRRRYRAFCFAGFAFGHENEAPPGAIVGVLDDETKEAAQMAWTEIMMLPQLYIAT